MSMSPASRDATPVNCHQTEDVVLRGGDFAAGKTSNLEIDRILRHYLPSSRILKCDTLPHLTREQAAKISALVNEEKPVFFPLFIRHHWIAGVLERTSEGTLLRVFDSAPSEPVHRDLKRTFLKFWPDLQLVHDDCAKQRRYSDDCGLYMVATFCAIHLGMTVGHADSLPERLREFLAKTVRELPPHRVFWKEMQRILAEVPKPKGTPPVLEGGATPRTRVEEWIRKAADADTACASRGLRYMLVATALASVADGVERAINPQALANRSNRLQFARRADVDIRTAIQRMGFNIAVYDSRRAPDTQHPWLFLTKEGQVQLPDRVGDYAYVLGAMEGERVRVGRVPPTRAYRLTQRSQETVVGLYIHHETANMPPATQRVAVEEGPAEPAPPLPPPPVDAGQEQMREYVDEADSAVPQGEAPGEEVDEDDDRRAALLVEPQPYLNWQGRRDEAAICPREWIIYSQRPRHVSQLSWSAVTPTIRQQHIRWLRELKTMPSDLLQLDLATAAIALVNRMHRTRRWKWSTHAKALSNIRAALLNLPLYTNARTGVDLAKYPQWSAAVTATHRYERETPAHPPPPIDRLQYQLTRQSLSQDPIPALYLGMMWSFAARAGDIGQLKARDIHFTPPADSSDPTVRVSLTVRRGKGARFRGPYTLASHLLRADASVLQQLMEHRRENQLLFSPLGPVKDKVRAALRLHNSEAALPSVRKGATRCLADQATSDEEVMRLTGHTRQATLQRYLGYGRHLTAEAVTAQDNAARALLAQNIPA